MDASHDAEMLINKPRELPWQLPLFLIIFSLIYR